MSGFSDEEVAYLRSQPLARIATVSPDGQPDAVPVAFDFDGAAFWIGGWAPENTRRHRNVRAGNAKVALVIDDLAPGEAWAPRFLRVYGTAELLEVQGRSGPTPVMKVTPTLSWSFNLGAGAPVSGPGAGGLRRTVHETSPSGEAVR